MQSENDLRPQTARPVETKTSAELNEQQPFDVIINKDDENNDFDLKQLLTFVPKKYKKNALTLLNVFEKYPNEISWNASGVIFINSVGIPRSNIYLIFPKLFKKSKAQHLPGFLEFIQKIKDLGFENLIQNREHTLLEGLGVQKDDSKTIVPHIDLKDTSVQWWYIGP